MQSILPYLQAQLKQHPGIQVRDILKLCYQAAYGGDHLLLDLSGAHIFFEQEFAAVQPGDGPLYEWISSDVARVNLRVWKQKGLPGEWLYRLFTLSAEVHCPGDLSLYLEEAEKLNFPGFAEAKAAYEREGCPSLHHSEQYRQLEQPAYRVVHRRLLQLIPILEKAVLCNGQTPCVLAIDGRAAAGKTTIGAQLAYVLGGAVIHMDHFFLPPELRTVSRLESPGGNIHWERFFQEVIPYLRNAESFSYRSFDCSRMAYGDAVCVPACSWRIVEGSYSLHPELGAYYDFSVFVSVSPEEQLARVEARNGAVLLKMFQEKWIPMEEQYFETFDVARGAINLLNIG